MAKLTGLASPVNRRTLGTRLELLALLGAGVLLAAVGLVQFLRSGGSFIDGVLLLGLSGMAGARVVNDRHRFFGSEGAWGDLWHTLTAPRPPEPARVARVPAYRSGSYVIPVDGPPADAAASAAAPPRRKAGVPRGLTIEAVYRGGVLVPTMPLDLPSGAPVRLAVLADAPSGWDELRARIGVATRLLERLRASRRARLLLGLIATGLAAAGQLQFRAEPPAIPVGALCFATAAVALALAQPMPPPPARGAPVRVLPADGVVARRWLFAAALAAALVSVALADLAATPPLRSYARATICWAGAILLILFAAASPIRRPTLAWTSSRRVARGLGGMLGVILLAGMVLRLWGLGEIPPTLGGDEGSQGLEAIKVLKGQINNPFSTGWLSVPTVSFYFNAPSIAWLGNTAFALRLPWALVGAVTVPVVFFLVARLHGVRLALLTAATLAAYHYHIHFSRLGSNQIADPLFVALALLFLFRGYEERSRLSWAIAGVVVGLAQYFYAGARFTAVVAGVLILASVLRAPRPFWRERRAELLAFGAAALITAAPMIQYAIRFPNEYNARINAVGIIQSGWLEREQQIRHSGAAPILLDQFQRAALAFNVYPDRTLWYGSPQPLLDAAAGSLFLLGLGYATLRAADRRLLPMVAWWWGAVILGGALTESPPSSQRLITLAPPVLFFAVLAIERLTHLILGAIRSNALKLLGPLLAVAALTWSVWSIKYYFADFTPLRVYGNPNAVVATALGEYARDDLGPDWRIYFFGPPRMYVGFGSIPYLAPEVEGVDVSDRLAGPIDRRAVKPDKGAAFVFLPERLSELELVSRTFPVGEAGEMPNPTGGPPLFVVYRVAREQLTR